MDTQRVIVRRSPRHLFRRQVAALHLQHPAEQVLQKDSPLQSDVRQALQQLTQTLQSLNALTDYLERHPESLIRGKKGDEQK